MNEGHLNESFSDETARLFFWKKYSLTKKGDLLFS